MPGNATFPAINDYGSVTITAETQAEAEHLAHHLPEGELIEIVARTADNFRWLLDRLDGPKRAKAEADFAGWQARMAVLLTRLADRRGRGCSGSRLPSPLP